MPHIVIQRPHHLTADQARQAAESLAQKLSERFEITHRWDGDSLHFERSGVSGHINLEPGLVRINAQLGFFLTAFQYPLEQAIHRTLDEIFQSTANPA